MLLNVLKSIFARSPDGSLPPASSSQQSQGSPAQKEFSHSLLTEFFERLHGSVEDNFDRARFGHEGVDPSRNFSAAQHAEYLHTYFDHANPLFSAYSLLRDEASRQLYRRLLLYRLAGHLHVRIKDGVGWRTEADILAKAAEFDAGPSGLAVAGLFGPIRHHENIPAAEGTIKLDCWPVNVAFTALKRQYYFSRDNVEIAPRSGDVVLDCGACFGDTAVYFASSVGQSGHVHAFDPLPSHNEVLALNIRQNEFAERITGVACAVGDKPFDPGKGGMGQSGSTGSALPGFSLLSKNPGFPVTTLDGYAEKNALDRVDFIKMDIEGYELPALRGARNIIKRFRPRLAISLYHKPVDMFEIPLWIHENFPDYELYLDHYTIHQEETVLYARAP